jgi:hypothetical protein
LIRTALLCLLVLSSPGFAAGRAGNGFAVRCRPEAGGLAGGYYSLDYLVTMGQGASRPVKSWAESAARIKKLLAGVLSRAQLDLFEDFVTSVRNTDDYSRRRVWEPAPFGVINLRKKGVPEDPDPAPVPKEQLKSNLRSLVSELPEPCKNSEGDSELIPAVVFQDEAFTGRPVGYLVYKFVPQLLNDLEVTDPLQLSYLYLHEWLWDISNSEDRNRRINQLLHSERVEKMSPAQLRKQLVGMGLNLGPDGELEPRFGSSEMREAFERSEIPVNRLSFEETIQDLLLERQYPMLISYRAYVLSRTCHAPLDCTPWERTTANWIDPRTGSVPVPPGGEIFIRREEGKVLLHVKSLALDIDRGPAARIVTECSLDPSLSDDTVAPCRKNWIPETIRQSFGAISVKGAKLSVQASFTKDVIWIGAHAVHGSEEIRVAFVAPYSHVRNRD